MSFGRHQVATPNKWGFGAIGSPESEGDRSGYQHDDSPQSNSSSDNGRVARVSANMHAQVKNRKLQSTFDSDEGKREDYGEKPTTETVVTEFGFSDDSDSDSEGDSWNNTHTSNHRKPSHNNGEYNRDIKTLGNKAVSSKRSSSESVESMKKRNGPILVQPKSSNRYGYGDSDDENCKSDDNRDRDFKDRRRGRGLKQKQNNSRRSQRSDSDSLEDIEDIDDLKHETLDDNRERTYNKSDKSIDARDRRSSEDENEEADHSYESAVVETDYQREGKTSECDEESISVSEEEDDFEQESQEKQEISRGIASKSATDMLGTLQFCLVERDTKGSNKLFPQYNLYFQDRRWNKTGLALIAKKQMKNRTPNYHIFDMRDGYVGKRLSKKSGNYMGKLRSNFHGSECTIYGRGSSKYAEQVGAVYFDKPSMLDKMVNGTRPRLIRACIPRQEGHSQINGPKLIELLKAGFTGSKDELVLGNKAPVFERGCYRLHFGGRVTVPSVKNFQLVDIGRKEFADQAGLHFTEDVILQFGKVDDHRFHLDFRAPLSAHQAFAIALTQFNF